MTDFKAKMHQNFDFGWAPPQTPVGVLTTLPQAPMLDLGAASRQRGGAGLGKRRERGRGRGGRGKWRGGPKLQLNQGPSVAT